MDHDINVIVIGGGAAGLMCAIEAGKRGRSVVVIERAPRIGEKIHISGGGKCNFTNESVGHDNFLSSNQNYCRSALARFTARNFVEMVERHGIPYHEKKLGQLFCDTSSRDIIAMLERECVEAGVVIRTGCAVTRIGRIEKRGRFRVESAAGTFEGESLVIATGGLSIPKLGATSFGYATAKQFGLNVTALRPGLVPFLFGAKQRKIYEALSGISLDAVVRHGEISFRENILITHRGLSGPAILQISSYWNEGDEIVIDLLPEIDIFEQFKSGRKKGEPVERILERYLPKRFVSIWMRNENSPGKDDSHEALSRMAERLHSWKFVPAGTEGYGKAEVTAGGVDTNELSSKTMEAKHVPGLYFIGEVVDVTGWLGGYNFQWAWSSGYVAGQYA